LSNETLGDASPLASLSRFTLPVCTSPTFSRLRHERAAEGAQSHDRYSLQLLLDPVNGITRPAGVPFADPERRRRRDARARVA